MNLWRYSVKRLGTIIIVLTVLNFFISESGHARAQVNKRPDSSADSMLLPLSSSTKKEGDQRVFFNGKQRLRIAAERLAALEPNLIVTLHGPKYAGTLAAIANLGYRVESTQFGGTYLIHLEPVSSGVKPSNVLRAKAQDVFELSLELEPVGGIELIELNDRLPLGYR